MISLLTDRIPPLGPTSVKTEQAPSARIFQNSKKVVTTQTQLFSHHISTSASDPPPPPDRPLSVPHIHPQPWITDATPALGSFSMTLAVPLPWVYVDRSLSPSPPHWSIGRPSSLRASSMPECTVYIELQQTDHFIITGHRWNHLARHQGFPKLSLRRASNRCHHRRQDASACLGRQLWCLGWSLLNF